MLPLWRAGRCFASIILAAVMFPGVARAQPASLDSIPQATGPLTLVRAWDLVERYQPRIRAGDLRATAAQARIRDADRLLNPSVSVTEENFGGSLGSDHLESTLELGQVIQLGGDRAARAGVASSEYQLAAAEATLLRREVRGVTADRFIRAWSIQARLARLREGEQLTRQAIAAAGERFRAGASPVLERTRAESQAMSQAVERRRTEAELAIARRELAASWGDRRATFDSLVAEPLDDSPLPDSLGIGSHPVIDRARAQEAHARARQKLARSERIPDLTFSGGVRRLEDAAATGFVAGLELPVPLWNRGSGEVSAADQEFEAAEFEERTARQGLEVELANAVDRLSSAAAAFDSLRLHVRPFRQQLIEELLRAYRAGRLNYLDLIAEQRNLLETDLALVDAQADVWRSRVLLELLVEARPRQENDR